MNAKTKNAKPLSGADDVNNLDYVFQHGELTTYLTKLREVCNDMCHNYYWLAYVTLKAEGRKWRGRFVVWFSIDDAAEFFDKDALSKKEIRDYAREISGSFLDGLKTENFTRRDWRRFVAECNKTIEDYNR